MAAVKQYKSGNYQYYGATSYNINVGGNELREYNVLQEATVSSMNGYYASNLALVPCREMQREAIIAVT